jgi:hypothetical protein
MKLGPGGASGLENGSSAIQASNAVSNSGLNRRSYRAARSSCPSFRAWIHVLNVETSRSRYWPPSVSAWSASFRIVEDLP